MWLSPSKPSSQSLLRQGERSDLWKCADVVATRWVSIPSSSGRAFGPPKVSTRSWRKRVSIPSSSGRAFGQGARQEAAVQARLNPFFVRASVRTRGDGDGRRHHGESQSLLRQGERSDNDCPVLKSTAAGLNPFFVRASVRTDRCRQQTHYQRVAVRHVQPHRVPQSQPPSPALRLLGCQRALVTTRNGCRWRAGFYHRPPAPCRSTPDTLGCRRGAGR